MLYEVITFLSETKMIVARDANVPAIYCEYLGAGTCHPAGVEAYVEGCLNVMAEFRITSYNVCYTKLLRF